MVRRGTSDFPSWPFPETLPFLPLHRRASLCLQAPLHVHVAACQHRDGCQWFCLVPSSWFFPRWWTGPHRLACGTVGSFIETWFFVRSLSGVLRVPTHICDSWVMQKKKSFSYCCGLGLVRGRGYVKIKVCCRAPQERYWIVPAPSGPGGCYSGAGALPLNHSPTL